MADPIDAAVDRLLRGEPIDRVVEMALSSKGGKKNFANKGQKLGKTCPVGKKKKRGAKSKLYRHIGAKTEAEHDMEYGGDEYADMDMGPEGAEMGPEMGAEDMIEEPEEGIMVLLVNGEPVYDGEGEVIRLGIGDEISFGAEVPEEEEEYDMEQEEEPEVDIEEEPPQRRGELGDVDIR